MGICLQFETDQSVDAEAAEEIVAEAAELCSRQPWVFCEPLLPRIEEDGRLTGWSKLSLQPSPDEIETITADTAHDLQALLDSVVRWSDTHQLTWSVSLEGEFLGKIDCGDCDQSIRDTIRGMIELSGAFNYPERTDVPQLRLFDPEQN